MFLSLCSGRVCRLLALVPLLAPLLALTACGTSEKSDELPYIERPVDELYNDAADRLGREEYRQAAATFDEVDRQHPYSQWATRSQLMAAYALYQALRYEDAINALNRFIELHPGHPHVGYAYYLRALCEYERIVDVRRDQTYTKAAETRLNEVVRRFPNSAYARDATAKLDLVKDQLAGKEMEIGRFYLARGNYHAASKRFGTVISEYQRTTHVPEALHRLVECYWALGVKDEAQKTAAVLGHNYPNSTWYQDSYALLRGGSGAPSEPGWMERTLGLGF